MSKEILLEKLTDPTYREAFISEEIDVGIPMQLRAMREKRGWNQKYIAEKMSTARLQQISGKPGANGNGKAAPAKPPVKSPAAAPVAAGPKPAAPKPAETASAAPAKAGDKPLPPWLKK